ncbi:MAG: nucleoside-diphosphate sugar epimerase/dehydratase [Acidimicrobiia bacterium]|nr:nucleoside-diphosphate sugar epimerase/dehydratase [Acidimicrobiia bacterium]
MRKRTLLDGLVLVVALWGAYLLRFDFAIPEESVRSALIVTPFVLALQILALRRYGVHRIVGRYVSFDDLGVFAWSAVAWLVPMLAARLLLPDGVWRIPVSVSLIATILAVIGLLGVRLGQRLHAEVWSVSPSLPGETKPVLLVGAGEAGAMVARELSRSNTDLQVVGYVDDDPDKIGSVISGSFVFGSTEEIPRVVAENDVDHVIITFADPAPEVLQRIVGICGTVPIRARLIPSFLEVVQGTRSITAFQDVEVEDLLGRDPVNLDTAAEVVAYLEDRVVMVTGAGGSIGSELARQVAELSPSVLLLVERFEGSLFEIHRELSGSHQATEVVPSLADITDAARMQAIFDRYRPEVVVHAAAHKHVAMMEENPSEAIKNNTFGTKLIAEMSGEAEVSCFILVSTDKAVRPTSIMGASKRLAEMVVQQCNDMYENTRYVAVRFGNVMGSSGSVIPIFKEQVKKGGPVTVSHEKVTRYFMTIPEASRLVLTAGAIGQGGEVMVLDMGQPVRIIDLARNLIRLSGYVPGDDINIEITGLKQGEKLTEELYFEAEDMELTRHPKIFIGRPNGHRTLEATMANLATLVAGGTEQELRKALSSAISDSRLAGSAPPPPRVSRSGAAS